MLRCPAGMYGEFRGLIKRLTSKLMYARELLENTQRELTKLHCDFPGQLQDAEAG